MRLTLWVVVVRAKLANSRACLLEGALMKNASRGSPLQGEYKFFHVGVRGIEIFHPCPLLLGHCQFAELVTACLWCLRDRLSSRMVLGDDQAHLD